MEQYNGKINCKCGHEFIYKDHETEFSWLGGYVWVTCPKCGKTHLLN